MMRAAVLAIAIALTGCATPPGHAPSDFDKIVYCIVHGSNECGAN